MRKATMLALAMIIAATCFAGWERTYGGSESDYGYSMVVLADGSFIVVGSTYSFGAGSEDLYLVKADSLGDTLWTKTYGGTANDRGKSISKTADGGFIITGYTGSFGTTGENVYLLRTDENGDTLWTRTYVGNEGNCVQPTSDGGFIIAGNTLYHEGVVIKTDSLGATMWDFIYGFGGWPMCGAYSVVETYDGGYMVCGNSLSPIGIPERDEEDDIGMVFLRFSLDGDTLWSKYHFYGMDEVAGYSMVQSPDSGFVIAGFRSNYGPCMYWYSPLYAKINAVGDLLWSGSIDIGCYTEDSWAKSITLLDDGGFAITGYCEYYMPFLLRTDSEGDNIWIREYDDATMDRAYSVSATPDGGFLIVGYGNVSGSSYDITVIKTDSLGYTAIGESPSARPEEIAISVFPNPFNSAINIAIRGVGASDARSGQVGIEIFDITGHLVADLPVTNCGSPQFVPTPQIWQPEKSLGSGVYLVRAKIGDKNIAKRIVYLK